MGKFARVIVWEFIQNLPIFTGFVLARRAWAEGQPDLAVVWSLAGGVCAALVIALTEARKVAGHREGWKVILTNSLGMSLACLALAAYLGVHWISWLTDLVFGAVGGTGLSAAQSLADRKPVDLRHSLALGLAAVLVLLSLRGLLALAWPDWLNILIICLLATLLIALIDYPPDGLRRVFQSTHRIQP